MLKYYLVVVAGALFVLYMGAVASLNEAHADTTSSRPTLHDNTNENDSVQMAEINCRSGCWRYEKVCYYVCVEVKDNKCVRWSEQPKCDDVCVECKRGNDQK